MPRHFDPTLSGRGVRIGIVLARFNEAVTSRLLEGALTALRERGIVDDAIDVATVPGAFELPLAAQRLAVTGRYAALIALGAVVRGETPHFDFVAGEAAAGLRRTSLLQDLPVAFGLLTTDTMEQALERAGGTHGNKGYDAAMTALEMAGLLHAIQRG
jgi:6,7-dimethyl-8-ribityllumazine synthase